MSLDGHVAAKPNRRCNVNATSRLLILLGSWFGRVFATPGEKVTAHWQLAPIRWSQLHGSQFHVCKTYTFGDWGYIPPIEEERGGNKRTMSCLFASILWYERINRGSMNLLSSHLRFFQRFALRYDRYSILTSGPVVMPVIDTVMAIPMRMPDQ
jgi:hypothetical protein